MLNNQTEYQWVVGFIDGDGFLDLQRTKSHNVFYYKPVLAITQKHFQILYKIRHILKIGRISKRPDGYYHYRVQSQKLFHIHLIPIFKKYPFLSNKRLQFKLIIRCLKILKNYSGRDLQKQNCLNQYNRWIKKVRHWPIQKPNAISAPWFVGFFESEGCISVQQVSQSFRFVIKITQSERALLIAIQDFLHIGRINKERQNIYYWGISRRKDLPKLISIFRKYPLKSEKSIQWKKFLKLIRIEKIFKKLPEGEEARPRKVHQRFQRLLLYFKKN
uniref:Homing endonuclease LAGLIDADG domain-containing protein n=1 Tax=Caulerpa cliftonii TaxID=1004391 RepID=A0A1C9JBS3_9CHLO|nr:hypothetical protein [Caulerpa cliftonii]AOP19291.1 hypothetical protein [Caulerpa cliftonii]